LRSKAGKCPENTQIPHPVPGTLFTLVPSANPATRGTFPNGSPRSNTSFQPLSVAGALRCPFHIFPPPGFSWVGPLCWRPPSRRLSPANNAQIREDWSPSSRLGPRQALTLGNWSPSGGGESRLAVWVAPQISAIRHSKRERHYNDGRLSSGIARCYHEDAQASAEILSNVVYGSWRILVIIDS
jgi:hypothetical protein